MPKWQTCQLGRVEFQDTRTSLAVENNVAFSLANIDTLDERTLVPGSMGLKDDEIWVVEEADASDPSNFPARWKPLGSRPGMVSGGVVTGGGQITIGASPTVSDLDPNINWYRDRFPYTAAGGVPSVVTLPSADSGIYLFCLSLVYDDSAGTSGLSRIDLYDNTSAAVLMAEAWDMSTPASSGMCHGLLGTFTKSSGTAMELKIRITATGTRVFTNLYTVLVKLADLDPNALTTANPNATAVRPSAPA